MLELTFSSDAVTDLDRTSLSNIQKKSVDANSKMGVTGLLFFHRNEFVGILEGMDGEVEKRFAKFKMDKNHKNISVLAKGQIMHRHFEHWHLISCIKEKKGPGHADYQLFIKNILALARLDEKRTYGSRMFWFAVKESIERRNSF